MRRAILAGFLSLALAASASAQSIYNWSTTAGSNATADSGINMAEGMLPSAVNDGVRVLMARVAAWIKDQGSLSLSGTNTLTVTANSGFTAYATGRVIVAKVANDNTGAATLNVNSIGAKAVKKIAFSGEADVAAGDMQAGQMAVLVYDAAANSSSGAWILLNPTVPVAGTDVQAYDAELAAIAGLTSAADRVPYFTGSGTAALGTFTASGRDLVAQDIAADQYAYGDGSGSWAIGSITSAGRAILDDADAAAQRTTLGLGAAALVAYTTGTFTPTIIGTSTAGTGTYTDQVGFYTRIGNRVMFDITLTWTAHTGTGNIRIAGLPLTSSATAKSFSYLSTYVTGLTLTRSVVQAYVNVNSTEVFLAQTDTGGVGAIAMDTAASISVSGHYMVD